VLKSVKICEKRQMQKARIKANSLALFRFFRIFALKFAITLRMKNTTIILILLLATSMMLITSCGNSLKANKDNEEQDVLTFTSEEQYFQYLLENIETITDREFLQFLGFLVDYEQRKKREPKCYASEIAAVDLEIFQTTDTDELSMLRKHREALLKLHDIYELSKREETFDAFARQD